MSEKKELSKNLPKSIGFIMDGNRRWARENNLPELNGHLAGKDKFIEVASWVTELGIEQAIFYTFSTENWQRSDSEIEALMSILSLDLKKQIKCKVKVVGKIKDFSITIQENLRSHELASDDSSRTTIWLALSYGGRAEIIEAVNLAVKNGETVTEESFAKLLQTADMFDPDLIIRTGGERRLSNFLPWQSVYSELTFTDTYWPAFTKDEFERILSEYGKRERRHGR